VLGVHRPQDAAAFSNDDRQQLERILPHLQRALQVRHRMLAGALERAAMDDALERVGLGAVVVGRDGRILFANGDAERMMRDGNVLRSAGGWLTAVSPAASGSLAQLIESAITMAEGRGDNAGRALTLSREQRLPVTVLAAPLRTAYAGFGARGPAAIVLLRDPERLTAAGAALRDLFGLTAAEARIAQLLCRG
jgi:hypothetical protein